MKYPEQNWQFARGAWLGDDSEPIVSPRRVFRSAHKWNRSPKFTPVRTFRGTLGWDMQRQVRKQYRQEDRANYMRGLHEAYRSGIPVRVGTSN